MKFNYISFVTLMSAAGGAALAVPTNSTQSLNVPGKCLIFYGIISDSPLIDGCSKPQASIERYCELY